MKLAELLEMAAPTQAQLSKTYYHGTSEEKFGLGILKSGIEPGDIIKPTKPTKGANLIPVKGKVYITPDLAYAQMYAIGGDMAGSTWQPRPTASQVGYLFAIDGKDLADIDPDEDSVGEMIHNQLNNPKDNALLRGFAYRAQQVLTVGQLKKLKDGEYVMFAHLGKKLIPKMSDAEKLAFIDLGAHVAHGGKLMPKAAWKIDLTKIKDLKRDGSNFFDHAEKVL